MIGRRKLFLVPTSKITFYNSLKREKFLSLQSTMKGILYTKLVSWMHVIIKNHYHHKRVLWHRGLPTRSAKEAEMLQDGNNEV